MSHFGAGIAVQASQIGYALARVFKLSKSWHSLQVGLRAVQYGCRACRYRKTFYSRIATNTTWPLLLLFTFSLSFAMGMMNWGAIGWRYKHTYLQ